MINVERRNTWDHWRLMTCMRNFYWQIIIIMGKFFSIVTCLTEASDYNIFLLLFTPKKKNERERGYTCFNSDCFHKKLKQLLYRNILEHFINISYCMIVPLIWKCQHEKSLIHKEFKKCISDVFLFCFVLTCHSCVSLPAHN